MFAYFSHHDGDIDGERETDRHWWMMITLTSDDLDSHARMSRPRRSVELDVSRYDRLINVRVLYGERVHVAFEQLRHSNRSCTCQAGYYQ